MDDLLADQKVSTLMINHKFNEIVHYIRKIGSVYIRLS